MFEILVWLLLDILVFTTCMQQKGHHVALDALLLPLISSWQLFHPLLNGHLQGLIYFHFFEKLLLFY